MAMKVAIADRNDYRSKEELAMSVQMDRFLRKPANTESVMAEHNHDESNQNNSGDPSQNDHNPNHSSLIDPSPSCQNLRSSSKVETGVLAGTRLKKRVNSKRRQQITLATEWWEIKRRQKLKKVRIN